MRKEEKMDKERNLLSGAFRKLLDEHKVVLTDGTNVGEFYLIEVDADGTLISDFLKVYSRLGKFKQDLARKRLANDRNRQTYGVVVDEQMQYVFAFNRELGWVKEGQIVVAEAGSFLLDYAGPTSFFSSQVKNSDLDLTAAPVRFKNISLLDRVAQEYAKHTVQVEGQEMILVNFNYSSPTLQDCLETYRQELTDEFKLRVATQKFGEGNQSNTYGVFFDHDLRMHFVFNECFAHFNREKGELLYTSLEEVLLGNDKKISKTSPPVEPALTIPKFLHPRDPFNKVCTGGRICYAIIGPED